MQCCLCDEKFKELPDGNNAISHGVCTDCEALYDWYFFGNVNLTRGQIKELAKARKINPNIRILGLND